MFEKTPVRSTPQKVLTHRHKHGKVHDGIGRKMMELGTEEVQEAPEEGVRGKREAPVYVGGEQREGGSSARRWRCKQGVKVSSWKGRRN